MHIQSLKILRYFMDENPLNKFHNSFIKFSKRTANDYVTLLYKAFQKMKYSAVLDAIVFNTFS